MAPSDAQLVDRARRGDVAAFEALVRRYLRPAYAVALAGTREPADAEDVCQDAFVAALERLEECREPERFAGWLIEIVRNRARDAARRRRVRAADPLDAATEPVSPDDPSVAAERAELRHSLLAALETLTDRQREIVLLHDLEGWRHREIGERLGVSAGAARVHLHHARRALRAVLAPGYAKEANR